VVLHRNRGGSYLAVAISAIAMFGVFLFLTYYLQQNLGMSPVLAGVAFLPMVAMIMVSSITGNVRLVPRFGPRPLVPLGMALACAGMLYLTGLDVHSSYAGAVLPALLVLGLGFGLIFAPAIATATLGVAESDSGVASAMVNVSQQVGGSIGTALLSTIAVTASNNFVTAHLPSGRMPGLAAQAAVHGYTTAFMWSAIIFGIGAVVSAVLLERGSQVPAAEGERVPVMA
jgi:predicted MFS family arabinose efflux permease